MTEWEKTKTKKPPNTTKQNHHQTNKKNPTHRASNKPSLIFLYLQITLMGIRQPPAGSSLVLVKSFHSMFGGKESLCLMLFITVAADLLKLRNISLFALLLRAAKVKISHGFQASGCCVTAHPPRQARVPGLKEFHISNTHSRIFSKWNCSFSKRLHVLVLTLI